MSKRQATPGLVPWVLREYGALTREAVERYLPAGEPRRYLYDLVSDYPRRGGKAMRPSLCLATACAFGARPEEALFAAVLIELLHNASLIHDDIEDESEMRRGSPVPHQLHGVPLALNAGNSLALLSLRPLLDSQRQLGPELLLRILDETARTTRELAEGQALELGWRRDNVVGLGETDYLKSLGAAEVMDRKALGEPGKPLQKERWAGVVDSVGSHTLVNACAQTKAEGVVTACGLAQGMDLPATVAPFILRGVTLAGINSVTAPRERRDRAWAMLAADVPRETYDAVTETIGLAQAIERAPDVLAGRVRGRLVVDVNR